MNTDNRVPQQEENHLWGMIIVLTFLIGIPVVGILVSFFRH